MDVLYYLIRFCPIQNAKAYHATCWAPLNLSSLIVARFSILHSPLSFLKLSCGECFTEKSKMGTQLNKCTFAKIRNAFAQRRMHIRHANVLLNVQLSNKYAAT